MSRRSEIGKPRQEPRRPGSSDGFFTLISPAAERTVSGAALPNGVLFLIETSKGPTTAWVPGARLETLINSQG